MVREVPDEAWDEFVLNKSWNGTFLHTRRYLGHQGYRFRDRSIVLKGPSGAIVGLLPCAQHADSDDVVVSHPGLTYGGLLYGSELVRGSLVEALTSCCTRLRDDGYARLEYKAVPHIYHRFPAQDDLYAVSSLGGRLYRRDLAAVVDLEHRRPVRGTRRRLVNRATGLGLRLQSGPGFLEEFWPVLERNLGVRHGVRPVHTLEEITEIAGLFPGNVTCMVALEGDEVLAGGVLFDTGPTVHLQYCAPSERGREIGAMDYLLESCIRLATGQGHRFFSFGISSLPGKFKLNAALHDYKISFGAGSVAHDFYELDLSHFPT